MDVTGIEPVTPCLPNARDRHQFGAGSEYQIGVPEREDLALQMWIDAIEEKRGQATK